MSGVMDGTVSGEHGIRLEYRDQGIYELGKSSIDAMGAVKLALDPLCLLNPGKMIRMGQGADAGKHEDREHASSPGGFHGDVRKQR